MVLRNGFHAAHDLPLRHRIHGIDVVQTRLAVVVSLMHGIDAQISGLALRIRSAPFANRHLPRLRAFDPYPDLAVGRRAAQVVNVGSRDPRQSLILRLAVHCKLPLQNVPYGGPGKILVSGIHGRQQRRVRRAVAPWKFRP